MEACGAIVSLSVKATAKQNPKIIDLCPSERPHACGGVCHADTKQKKQMSIAATRPARDDEQSSLDAEHATNGFIAQEACHHQRIYPQRLALNLNLERHTGCTVSKLWNQTSHTL